MHRKVAAVLVAALVLVAAGCGGTEPLTRAQLVRKIETACAQGQRASQNAMRANRGSTGDAQKRFVAAISTGQQKIVDGIDDLDAPDSAKSAFETFKQAVTDRTAMFHRLESGSAAQIRSAFARAQPEVERLTGTMAQAARRLGVEGCI